MKSLSERRIDLALKFAKNCIKNNKFIEYFKSNKKQHDMKTRKTRKYVQFKAKGQRYNKKSPILWMQKLLNNETKE